ncbi:Membrane-fusion protein [Caenispirillum salinarum AK4]|uniref:Membrane-fusion protein n=1 Tax=Caenispirillum salinarum AK4 TaxID=1238182 RepID=K9GUX6_9PROT|nr:efflux RND transporter periplasmic adaptor subunit [Caenispirillum salinarum]EKV28544.1 Membrane-fusion protein [Caenispirillum salinarum AK4]
MTAAALLLWGGAAVPVSAQEPAPPVPSSDAALPAVDPELAARGLLVPAREAVLSSDIAGRLTDMPVRPGEAFEEGAVLAAFDCRLYEARLSEAEGRLAAARSKLASNRQLRQLGSIGDLEVAIARGETAEAQGAVNAAAVLVDRCRVTAPWSGHVVDWRARPQESVEAGAELLEIIDDTALEVEVIVPSPWLGWLAPGHDLTVLVDETGTEHPATITRLGARVDPVSQSVTVVARLTDEAPRLVAGMSGTARFVPPEPSSEPDAGARTPSGD